VSRALDFAFDRKDLANIGGIKDDSISQIKAALMTNHYQKQDRNKAKLQINSQQIISLDEKNEFSSQEMDNAYGGATGDQ